MRYLAFLIIVTISFSCKGTKDVKNDLTVKDETKTYEEIAVEKLGEGIQYVMNESENMVLCKKTIVSKHIPMGTAGSKSLENSNVSNTIQLLVVEIESGNILYEKSIAYGSVQWENDNQLKITEVMGANMVNNPNIYLYNVLTNKTTQLGNGKNTIEKR